LIHPKFPLRMIREHFECMDKGHTSLHPSLRACDRCLLENKICIKIAVLVTTDRESGNKNALESFSEEILDESIDRRLSTLSVLPGAVCPCCVHSRLLVLF
jgi:hypothetical protein